MATPLAITKATGAIILYAPIDSPLPEDFINAVASLRSKYNDDIPANLIKIMSEGKLIISDKSPEFNMALYDLLGRSKVRTILVAPMIPAETAIKLGFESASSIDEGILKLEKSYPNAKVAVLPAGGLIIPIK